MRSAVVSRAVSMSSRVGRFSRRTQADHVEPRGAGHAPVEDGDVVLVEAELVDGVVAARHGVDEEPVVLQPLGEHRAQAGVVLGHQDAHGQPAIDEFILL